MMMKPALVMINTLMGGSCGAICSLITRNSILRVNDPINTVDIVSISNGMIAGMISVCASADHLHPYETVITGCLASLTYTMLVALFEKLGIDDPLEASQAHIGGGLIGLISVGLFDDQLGYFYHGSLKSLSIQLAGALVITAWSAIISLSFFMIMKNLGRLRVSKTLELLGMDVQFEGII
jgi:Amt family ammonium transporter